MITSNVIHRVFRICYNGSEGTGFTIEVEGREYLITAKHVIESLNGNDTIDIFSNGGWTPHQVTLVGHAPDDADISVLAAMHQLTPLGLPMQASTEGLTYGQDVYFLGFPYGFTGRFIFQEGGYPLPFVKKAIVSLLDHKIVLLDGHNNPGFSGGPVVFTDRSNNFKVAAVISGFQAVEEPVLIRGENSEFTYKYNTGIIVAHLVNVTMDLIQSNPIGHRVS